MKKTLLSLVAFVMIIAGANAQTSFGVKAGLNLAKMGGDAEDSEMKMGLHVGGVANIEITEKFTLAPELLLSFQGDKYEEGDYSSKTKLSYINIPVLAKVYLTEGLNIHAGPYVGFLLSAKSVEEEDGEELEVDVKDFTKGLDFGLGFGLGYELESGLNFGARYNLGLGNVSDIEIEGIDNKVTNQVIQISVGFNF